MPRPENVMRATRESECLHTTGHETVQRAVTANRGTHHLHTPRSHSAPPKMNIILCADVRHTLGATEYAWLSYLAFAARLRTELAVPVTVLVSPSLGGLQMNMTVTVTSLNALEKATRLTIRLAPSSSECNHENNDILITDRVVDHSSGAEVEVVSKVAISPYTTSPTVLKGFLDAIWRHLRVLRDARAAPATSARPLAALTPQARSSQRPRTTSGPPLRISLSLVQATAGPLAHASAVLHDEAFVVMRALEIASPPGTLENQTSCTDMDHRCGEWAKAHSWIKSSYIKAQALAEFCKQSSIVQACPNACIRKPAGACASQCAYVFLGLAMGVYRIKLSTTQKGQAEKAFEELASNVSWLVNRSGLQCARLNAVFEPDGSEQRALSLFARLSPSLNVTIVRKHSFKGATHQWHEFAKFGGAGAPTAELVENLGERHASYTSALLILQSGSYWADWVLAKRTAEGRPSVILANAASARGTAQTRSCGGAQGSAPGPQGIWFGEASWSATSVPSSASACDECVFFRGHCATRNRWDPLMGREMGMCAHRWQQGVAQGNPTGKGVQKVAIVGC